MSHVPAAKQVQVEMSFQPLGKTYRIQIKAQYIFNHIQYRCRHVHYK